MAQVIVPPALRPGDRVRVVAPSGPFDRALVLRGLGWLRERYDVRFGPGVFARSGYLAGTDDRRARELGDALDDPATRAVVATRGGYGLTRIAHALDLHGLRDAPKWIVGFSDVTALHAEAQRVGVASLHAQNLAGLGRGDARGRAAWLEALEHPSSPRTFSGLTVWRGGTAEGPLAGGNLTVLFSCAAAGRLRLPQGCVLFLEDIGEAPYRVDRMLSALMAAGALDGVAGCILGDFTDAPPGRYGVPIDEVLRERLLQLRIPLLAGFPAGHGMRNEPLHLGLLARVGQADGTVQLGEPPA
jgi:muramoyltetrapeptide carboxypeptidase